MAQDKMSHKLVPLAFISKFSLFHSKFKFSDRLFFCRKKDTVTELLDVLDENYGEEDQKNRNDRNALELVLYPPVHEDDIDSVGDSASDNDVEPSEVLSRLSRTLLNTDAELHDKAVAAVEEEEEEEDFFSGWTLAEVQKQYNNLGPVRRKSHQATIPAGGNVDPHERHEGVTNSESDPEDGQLFTKPSQSKKKKQDKRKNQKEVKRKSRKATIPAGGNVDPHERHEGVTNSGSDSEDGQLFAKPLLSKKKKQDERKKAKPRKKSVNDEAEKNQKQEPAKRKSQHTTTATMTKSTRKRKAAAIPAGGNVGAAILAGGNVEAAILAGGNVEAGPSKRDNTDEEEEEEEEQEDGSEQVKRNKKSKRSKEYERIWSNDETKVGSQVGNFDPPENSYKSDEVQSCHRPYEFFRLFTNDDYLNEIVYQSRLYAHQNGKSRQAGEINLDSLLCLQAVMLLSGYNSVPNRRMYWQDQPDTRCPIVYDNIRRDTIDHIISILHFVDNSEESNDRSVLPSF